MDEAKQFSVDGDEVVIRISTDDYDRLLILMGFAVGAAYEQDRGMAYRFLDLVNRVNKGNPKFIPYEIPQHLKGD